MGWVTNAQGGTCKGPFGARKSSQTSKIISTLRGLKVRTIFGGSGDCVTPNSPQFLEIIPQPAGRHPNSAAEHEKTSSGLKLTVRPQQPLCNGIGSDKGINMYHTYILVTFFHPMQQRTGCKTIYMAFDYVIMHNCRASSLHICHGSFSGLAVRYRTGSL